jgi:hypothetical protein
MRTKRIKIRGPLTPGQKIVREVPDGAVKWPRQFRFYNPDGEPFEIEVNYDHWIQGRVKDGEIEIVVDKPRIDKPQASKPRADKE